MHRYLCIVYMSKIKHDNQTTKKKKKKKTFHTIEQNNNDNNQCRKKEKKNFKLKESRIIQKKLCWMLTEKKAIGETEMENVKRAKTKTN